MSCNNQTQFITASQARIAGRDNNVIFQEICAIQQAILDAIDNGRLEVVVADNSPMTSVNEIKSVTILNSGTGYEVFKASATISHPSGTGALITPIVSGSIITGFSIDAPGTGYDPVKPVADLTTLGSGNADVQLIEFDGQIIEANILVPGTGYVPGTQIPVIHPNGVNANIQIATVDTFGAITSVNIVNPGQNYNTIYPEVVIDHPTGTGFRGVVETNVGQVVNIIVVDGGSGYGDIKPSANVIDTRGSGAVLDVVLDNGQIVNINVVKGGAGYTAQATIEIVDSPVGTGSGAVAIPQVDTDDYNSVDYYRVWAGHETSREITDQLNQVSEYFRKLGYTIQIEVNPLTSNTIQWHVLW